MSATSGEDVFAAVGMSPTAFFSVSKFSLYTKGYMKHIRNGVLNAAYLYFNFVL